MKNFRSQDWIREIEKLPVLSELQRNLKNFSEIDMSKKTQLEIRNAYFNHCNLFPYVFEDSWTADLMNQLITFRVRTNVNKEKEDITNPNTYRYPPDDCCKYNGRANIKGNSVFYGAFDAQTAVIETKPEKEQIQYFTTWKNNSKSAPFFATFLPFNLPMDNLFKEYSIKKYIGIEFMCNQIGLNKTQELIELSGTFAKWFQTGEYPYSITSWISNTYIVEHKIDFIIYPSVQLESKTFCIAYTKNYINDNMILDRVIEYKISGIKNNKSKVNLIQAGSNINGKIEFSEPNENDVTLMNLK